MGISVSKSNALQELKHHKKSKTSPENYQRIESVLTQQQNNRGAKSQEAQAIQAFENKQIKLYQSKTCKDCDASSFTQKSQGNFAKKKTIDDTELQKQRSQVDIQAHNQDSIINQNKQNVNFKPNNMYYSQNSFKNNKTIHQSHFAINKNGKQSKQPSLHNFTLKTYSNESERLQTDELAKKQNNQNIKYQSYQNFSKQLVSQKGNNNKVYSQNRGQNGRHQIQKYESNVAVMNQQEWDLPAECEQKAANDKRSIMSNLGIILSNKFSENERHFSQKEKSEGFSKFKPLQMKESNQKISFKQGGLKAISLCQHPQSAGQNPLRKNYAPFL